jgi:ADP-ribose pyrophosphatase YjhB (NUDIX family)
MAFVRVAGGLVWREGPKGPLLAVVHRPGRRDWSLPKGRARARERWDCAALREIAEETGCEARITGFAGAKVLMARREPKVVIYWHMRVVRAGKLETTGEVDEVLWLSPRQALARLDHVSDRRLLRRAISRAGWMSRRAPPRSGARTASLDLQQWVVVDAPHLGTELAGYLRVVESAVC